MEENYIVSARKYRPSTFSSVVGQKALTATLRNAIQTNRLAHAYLFCGSRGVGKTTCARIFAKSINCANPTADGDPCNECPSCRSFNENRSLNIIELDAASNNSVDDIRNLTDQVQIPPVDGRYRVFIVDEVHMLSQAAFNAFLKTLEEPPAHAIFILATTEKHKIIPTILSRCQIYDFKRITIEDTIDHLEYVAKCEGMTAERSALGVIARKADGAMRDALSIFDQVAASSRGTITYQSTIDNLNILDERYYTDLVESFRDGDVTRSLLIYKEIRDKGFDSYFFLGGLAGFIRDLMVARDPQTIALLDTDSETRGKMAALGVQLPPQFFYAAMSMCNDADMAYRTASSKTFLLELLLIKLCQLQSPSPASEVATGEGHRLKPITPATASQSTPAATGNYQPTTQRPAATAPPAPPSYTSQTPTAPTTVPATQVAAPSAPAQPHPSMPPQVSRAPLQRNATPASVRSKAHVSLRNAFSDAPAATAESQTATAQPRNSAAFTDKQLDDAWESYMELHPKAHVLCNTMRASRPTRDNPSSTTLRMTVANQPQVDVMEQETPGLLDHLRRQLSNDFIQLEIAVSTSPDSPAAWSDRDLLKHIIENNPHAADFIKDFGLTIS